MSQNDIPFTDPRQGPLAPTQQQAPRPPIPRRRVQRPGGPPVPGSFAPPSRGPGAAVPPELDQQLGGYSDEFTGFLQGLGIDPSQLAGGNTGANAFSQPTHVLDDDGLRPIDSTASDLFVLPRNELIDLQNKLFASGFYGATPYDRVRIGARDPDTFRAFRAFLDQAALFNQEQQPDTTWRRFLNRLVSSAGGVQGAIDAAEEEAEEGGGVEREPTFVVSLTDPAAIRKMLDSVSRDVIGRRLTPSQEQKFIGMFHNQQKSAQLAAQRAQFEGGGGTVTVTQPTLEGQADEFLRQQFPQEAGAEEAAQYYEVFLDMIGGRGGGRR